MKANEAKKTRVWVMENGKPTQTDLYSFVMESAEMTTSPRGVENKLHIREVEQDCSCVDEDGQHSEDCEKCYRGCQLVYSVYDWGFRGQYLKHVETFETYEEAEDFIFQQTWRYDFDKECNRSTFYADSAAELLADVYDISHEAAESYYKHYLKAESTRADRNLLLLKKSSEEAKRIEDLANIYAAMIEPLQCETHEQTVKRLSTAIGSRIEKKVFYKAVSIIRSK